MALNSPRNRSMADRKGIFPTSGILTVAGQPRAQQSRVAEPVFRRDIKDDSSEMLAIQSRLYERSSLGARPIPSLTVAASHLPVGKIGAGSLINAQAAAFLRGEAREGSCVSRHRLGGEGEKRRLVDVPTERIPPWIDFCHISILEGGRNRGTESTRHEQDRHHISS